MSRDKDNPARRLMLPGTNNLARGGDGLAFAIYGEPVGALVWEREPARMSADDALAAERAEPTKNRGLEAVARKNAEAWLRDLLADGPMPAAKIEEAAKEARMSWNGAVRRAREAMGIKPYRESFEGRWIWRLPAEGAQVGAHLGPREITCAPSTEPAHLGDSDAIEALFSAKQASLGSGGAHLGTGPLSDNDLHCPASEDVQVPGFSPEAGCG